MISTGTAYFNSSINSNISTLKQTLDDYGASSKKFNLLELKEKDGGDGADEDDDDVILGLTWWQIGVIIAGIVAFILLIAVICLCVST